MSFTGALPIWLTSIRAFLSNTLLMEEDFDEMGDLAFLTLKTFEGKTRDHHNSRTTTGDLATLTATTGKDMYLVRAKVNFTGGVGVQTYSGTVKLTVNAVVVEICNYVNASGTGSTAAQSSYEYEFVWRGKVASTQIIKLDLTAVTAASVEGVIEVFEETTGVSPRPAALTQGTATIIGGIAGSLGFLAKKEFEGKLRQADGSLTTTGDLATLTANSGKDMYLASASCTITGITNGTVVLKINGVIVSTFQTGAQVSGGSGDYTESYYFPIGFKVAATQIIKLECTALSASSAVSGQIQCFEETTGANPTA